MTFSSTTITSNYVKPMDTMVVDNVLTSDYDLGEPVDLYNLLHRDNIINEEPIQNTYNSLLEIDKIWDELNHIDGNKISALVDSSFHDFITEDSTKLRLLVCTTNSGKVNEMNNYFKYNAVGKALSAFFKVEYVSPSEDVEEGAYSTESNAALKSNFYSNKYKNGIVYSEDSGFFINSINNYPGVVSSRFASLINDNKLVYIPEELSKLIPQHRYNDGFINSFTSLLQIDDSTLLTNLIAEMYGVNPEYTHIVDAMMLGMNRNCFLNKVSLLVLMRKLKREVEAANIYFPSIHKAFFKTTSSVSVEGSSLVTASGYLNGKLSLPENLDISNLLEIYKDFGYNSVFIPKILTNTKVLSKFNSSERVMWDHRSQSISHTLISLLYKVFKM